MLSLEQTIIKTMQTSMPPIAWIANSPRPRRPRDSSESLRDRNDEVLERIYIGRRFTGYPEWGDTERLEKLFELYTKMTA